MDDGWTSPESTLEYVVNKLTQERIEQLKKQITDVKTDYHRLLDTSKKVCVYKYSINVKITIRGSKIRVLLYKLCDMQWCIDVSMSCMRLGLQ